MKRRGCLGFLSTCSDVGVRVPSKMWKHVQRSRDRKLQEDAFRKEGEALVEHTVCHGKYWVVQLRSRNRVRHKNVIEATSQNATRLN